MALRVIGTGFGRTVTKSFIRALESLGYAPFYHILELWNDAKRLDLWTSASQGVLLD